MLIPLDELSYMYNSDKWRLSVYFDGFPYLPLKKGTFAFSSKEQALEYYTKLVTAIKKRLNKFDYEYDSFSFSYSLLPPGHVEY